MRHTDRHLLSRLDVRLRQFNRTNRPLPGVRTAAFRRTLVARFVESIRRIKYISIISARDISTRRGDPSTDIFDPLKAALLRKRQGQIDEAFWLVFLSVHFGKNRRTGWSLAQDVYGRIGPVTWDWVRTSSDPKSFTRWLSAHRANLSQGSRGFGNHRKYESLNTIGAVVESYVRWVGPPRTHTLLVEDAQRQTGGDPRKTFDFLYRSMGSVVRFGRTARFDYLTMVGKLGLAAIEPGSTYMQGATGPLTGARLLFGGRKTAALSPSDLERWLVELEAALDLGTHGMEVLEDALCNWQKNPSRFIPFKG